MTLLKITCNTVLSCSNCVDYIHQQGYDAVQIGDSLALVTDFEPHESRQVNQMQRFNPRTHEANQWDKDYFNGQVN